ncbi:ATP-binding cassette domain-containing protein [Serratia marcescens]|uniref:ABC transporter permease n=1 Tax=Serratia marcescens TaxID=615 RepID=UPI000F7F7E25|nr:ABC transporter permease [Serratia marcescens]RTF35745.1 ATP-binding cassette domain-containing protein [Serratia marcescens]
MIELSVENLHLTYGDNPVLKGVSMDLKRGEVVSLLGPSGSGKTTLLRAVAGLEKPSQGRIVIGNNAVYNGSARSEIPAEERNLGLVFQSYALWPHKTVFENVAYPLKLRKIASAEITQRVQAVLEQLGLGHLAKRHPHQLSGGQQQRVSIARSLINGGEIILADEPTGALDTQSGQEVLAILSELNQRGHTVVIVTHDMKVAQHAQRVIELQDGKIIADSGRQSAPAVALPPPNRSRQSGWQSLIDRTRESLHMALKAMNAHRLRTALTMTGIIFGIAAVVTVVALGEGAKQRTLENIKGLGTNVVSIYPGRDFFDDAIDSIRTLVPADADALAQQSFVDSVSPEVSASDSIRFRSKSATASITGVGRDYFRVNGITLVQGATFRDDRNALQEVIIDDNARQALFGDFGVEPLGQIVFLGSVPARVVGVAKSERNYAPNRISVWMPYSTVMYRMVGKTTLSGITVRLKDDVASEAAVSAITQLLTQRHGVKDFMTFNRDQFRKSIERTSMTLSLLILMVASISLVIGSLGVMNIMLVSVTERTHEIGIRMAVGAAEKDIMRQFLIEAVVICSLGGVLGIACAALVKGVLSGLAPQVTMIFTWPPLLLACGFSALIGVGFGFFPARTAARLQPVEALARE